MIQRLEYLELGGLIKYRKGRDEGIMTQVIQFAEFLSFDKKSQEEVSHHNTVNEEGYIRKPGILRRKMVMADDFDETPECFKEYL